MKQTSFGFVVTLFISQTMISCDVKENFVVPLEQIPLATHEQNIKLAITQNFLLGIRAFDPINRIPVQNSQNGTWTLLWNEKANSAGIFNRYGTERESHGTDWNFMMSPFNDSIYHRALRNVWHRNSEWPGCTDYTNANLDCGGYNANHCMWAEIAPYSGFINENRWFENTHEDHCKEGFFLKKRDTLGVYGYVVRDRVHGENPEIHPAQQIWFRNKGRSIGEKNYFWLMFFQDDSQRFNEWVASPVYGQYLIAFKVKPRTETLTINISIAHKEDLIPDLWADCDNGFSHTLIVNNEKIVTVNETNSDKNFLGINFVELTKLSAGEIQGYVEISMVLGDDNTDAKGVCILEAEIIKSRLKFTHVPDSLTK